MSNEFNVEYSPVDKVEYCFDIVVLLATLFNEFFFVKFRLFDKVETN